MTLFGSSSRASYKVKQRPDGTRTLQVESVRSGMSRGGRSQLSRGTASTNAGWERMLSDKKQMKGAEAAIRAVLGDLNKRYAEIKDQEARLKSEAYSLQSEKQDFNDRRSRAIEDLENERDELSQRESQLEARRAESLRRSEAGSQYTGTARSVGREAPAAEPITVSKSYRSEGVSVRSRSVGRTSRRSGKSGGSRRTATRRSEPRYEPT